MSYRIYRHNSAAFRSQGRSQKVHNLLSGTANLGGCAPKKIGETEICSSVVRRSEADRVSLCRVLEGNSLFGALYEVHSLTLTKLKNFASAQSCHLLPKQPRMKASSMSSRGGCE